MNLNHSVNRGRKKPAPYNPWPQTRKLFDFYDEQRVQSVSVSVTQPENQPEVEIISDDFDPDCAQKIFADTLDRLNNQYPFGAIDWAKLHRPELWEACQRALAQVEAAFRAQDMAAIRRAATEFERVNRQLFEVYPALPWRPGQKGTGSRVWHLSDEQAQELEAIFAAPGVVERVNRKGQVQRWHSPTAWEEYRKMFINP